jgi:thiol-disulfide isomerase/thioredoxin
MVSAIVAHANAGERDADRANAKPVYDTAVRGNAELSAALVDVCARSLDRDRPLLLEFSAPWCSDCLVLHRMKQQKILAAELARWPHIVINVGEFEEHPELLEAFEVRSIARWVVLRPSTCEAPVSEWPRIAQRTLEPDSSEEHGLSPGDLAVWLESLRTR